MSSVCTECMRHVQVCVLGVFMWCVLGGRCPAGRVYVPVHGWVLEVGRD